MKKLIISLGLVAFLLLPFSAFAFNDVTDDTPFKESIEYLRKKEVVNGYEDGSYRPKAEINRAEFLKIVFESAGRMGESLSEEVESCFNDVAADAWFAKYICKAKELGVVSGYPDGNFKPAQNVNLVEAMKIIIETHQVGYNPAAEGEAWYLPYLNKMAGEGYVPDSFKYLEQNVSRGEMAEMVWRLMEKKSGLAAAKVDELKVGCMPWADPAPDNVDMAKVRAAWIKWLNGARAEAGLPGYNYNQQLNRTASDWSKFSAERGYIDHKRPGTTAYYDYNAITEWYRERGLVFANWNRVTHSENIGWNVYKCSADDCTDYLIKQLRPTFDFYMAEKNKASRPHYDSVMNSKFREIGLGIAVGGGKLFITTHYGTEITSSPKAICTD